MKQTLRAVGGWCGLAGAGLLVWAARSGEAFRHGGDVPFLDQWKIEGLETLRPWLAGSLSPADFFRAHHEHLPVWTRLLAWLEAVATGQWDPRVQMAVNALLHAGFVVLVLRWLWSALGFGAATAASALLLATAMLPAAWENITWGFQSQFPLALLGLFLHVHGSLTHPAGSARWWAAQAAGVAGLFTLGGMATAPLAVALVLAWTGAGRRTWLAPALIATAGFVLLWALGAERAGPVTELHVHSLPRFIYAWFVQLGWPAGTVLLNLPLFLLALQLRRRSDATPFDRIVLALGLWAVFQAAAIGYARGNGYVGYVSRYGELLAVGLLANFLATLRLAWLDGAARGLRPFGALAWLAVAGIGLYTINTTAHTVYFHEHSAEQNTARRAAVLAYAQDGNSAHLEGGEIRLLLYPVVTDVAGLLAQPGFRALMPVFTEPSAAGRAVRQLQAHWAALALLGCAGVVVGLYSRRNHPGILPAISLAPDPWRLRCLALVAVAAWAGLFLWPHPLIFGEFRRKLAVLRAPGTIAPLEFQPDGASAYTAARAVGAARLASGDLRNIFHGTHLNGPEDRLRLRSDSFALVTPYLTVPFAGHPAEPGISLQVVVEDASGHTVHTYTCAEPARDEVGFWEIELSAHQGKSARIVLDDQSSTAAGWIAATSPQYAWKPGQGETRRAAWKTEETAFGHQSLGEIGAILTLGSLLIVRRRPKITGRISAER